METEYKLKISGAIIWDQKSTPTLLKYFWRTAFSKIIWIWGGWGRYSRKDCLEGELLNLSCIHQVSPCKFPYQCCFPPAVLISKILYTQSWGERTTSQKWRVEFTWKCLLTTFVWEEKQELEPQVFHSNDAFPDLYVI